MRAGSKTNTGWGDTEEGARQWGDTGVTRKHMIARSTLLQTACMPYNWLKKESKTEKDNRSKAQSLPAQTNSRLSKNKEPSSNTATHAEDLPPKGDSSSTNKTFYLFARTGREKEEWYNNLVVAANFMKDCKNLMLHIQVFLHLILHQGLQNGQNFELR